MQSHGLRIRQEQKCSVENSMVPIMCFKNSSLSKVVTVIHHFADSMCKNLKVELTKF